MELLRVFFPFKLFAFLLLCDLLFVFVVGFLFVVCFFLAFRYFSLELGVSYLHFGNFPPIFRHFFPAFWNLFFVLTQFFLIFKCSSLQLGCFSPALSISSLATYAFPLVHSALYFPNTITACPRRLTVTARPALSKEALKRKYWHPLTLIYVDVIKKQKKKEKKNNYNTSDSFSLMRGKKER